jgi:hypothetical protein
MQQVFDNFIA